MNEFYTISIHASEGRLLDTIDSQYYASDEFRQRSALKGPDAVSDQLAVTHYLLAKMALDPREKKKTAEYLDKGVVLLRFFGISNPVGWLEIDPLGAEMARLRLAIDVNLASTMNKAAHRVLKWRRSLGRERQVDAVMDQFRITLPWPDAAAHKANSGKAREETDALIDVMNAKRVALRERRRTRLAALSRATAPTVANWMTLIQDIAINVLTPDGDAAYRPAAATSSIKARRP